MFRHPIDPYFVEFYNEHFKPCVTEDRIKMVVCNDGLGEQDIILLPYNLIMWMLTTDLVCLNGDPITKVEFCGVKNDYVQNNDGVLTQQEWLRKDRIYVIYSVELNEDNTVTLIRHIEYGKHYSETHSGSKVRIDLRPILDIVNKVNTEQILSMCTYLISEIKKTPVEVLIPLDVNNYYSKVGISVNNIPYLTISAGYQNESNTIYNILSETLNNEGDDVVIKFDGEQYVEFRFDEFGVRKDDSVGIVFAITIVDEEMQDEAIIDYIVENTKVLRGERYETKNFVIVLNGISTFEDESIDFGGDEPQVYYQFKCGGIAYPTEYWNIYIQPHFDRFKLIHLHPEQLGSFKRYLLEQWGESSVQISKRKLIERVCSFKMDWVLIGL